VSNPLVAVRRWLGKLVFKYGVHPASHWLIAWRWRTILRAEGYQPRYLVDCGANRGHFGRVLAKVFAILPERLHSIEPNPDYYDAVPGNLYACALSDRNGRADMFHSDTSGHITVEGLDTGPVLLRRLDTIRPVVHPGSILKVDCESHTYKALLGAGDTLREYDSVLLEQCNSSSALAGDWNKQAEIAALMLASGFDRCDLCYTSVGLLDRQIHCYDQCWTKRKDTTACH
jgi:FkbM family methyltransferase